MLVSDLSEVILAENQVQVSPWSRASFEESLSREHKCRVLVKSEKELNEIVAFYVICPIADEMHILNFLVVKSHQGLGIGHVLMQDIVEVSQQSGQVKRIFLEVRESNIVAQNLYHKWQFQQLSIRKNYYRTLSQGREDALILFREI